MLPHQVGFAKRKISRTTPRGAVFRGGKCLTGRHLQRFGPPEDSFKRLSLSAKTVPRILSNAPRLRRGDPHDAVGGRLMYPQVIVWGVPPRRLLDPCGFDVVGRLGAHVLFGELAHQGDHAGGRPLYLSRVAKGNLVRRQGEMRDKAGGRMLNTPRALRCSRWGLPKWWRRASDCRGGGYGW